MLSACAGFLDLWGLTMAIDPLTSTGASAPADTLLRRVLGGMSLFTLLMTIPQVLTIWVSHEAAGVSVLSWSAYLVSAFLWFWHGLRRSITWSPARTGRNS